MDREAKNLTHPPLDLVRRAESAIEDIETLAEMVIDNGQAAPLNIVSVAAAARHNVIELAKLGL